MPTYYNRKSQTQLNNTGTSTIPDLLWTPPESITCLDSLNVRLNESDSCNLFNVEMNGDKTFYDPKQTQNGQDKEFAENKFHRSFSMIQGWNFYSMNPGENELEMKNYDYLVKNNCNEKEQSSKVVMRKKKTCLCDSGEI